MSEYWWAGFGDVDIAYADPVLAVLDANGADTLPYGARACSCPHGTGNQHCCIKQLALGEF